jgi:hypothetical protein
MSKKQLETAEAAMAEAQVVKPDAKELEAIKLFCAEEIKQRERVANVSDEIKSLRAQQKAYKEALAKGLQGLQADGKAKCAMLSKADAARLEGLTAAAGLPSVPPYVRLVQTNKDATITAEVIQEAIEALSEDDIADAAQGGAAAGGPAEAIKSAVLQTIRRSIRSFTESLKIMPSVQRGLGPYDVLECTPEMADAMHGMWTTEDALKKALATKKTDPEVAAKMTDFKGRIEAFFVRTGLTAQRIVVENKPFRLVRRVSVRKPKVGIGLFEKMLNEALTEVGLTGGAAGAKFRPSDLIRALQIQISSVAPETKSNVSLCAIKSGSDGAEK